MVFQQQAVVPDILPQDLGVLVQDAQQGGSKNDTGLVVRHSVGQGKAEGGQGLAAAGGDVQAIDAAGPVRRLPAPAGDLPPGLLDGGVVVELVQLFLHAGQEPKPKGILGLRES